LGRKSENVEKLRPVAEGVATVAALTVMQDVPVDAITQTRSGSTSGSATYNAINNHSSRRTEQCPDGTAKKADLRSGQSRSDTASRSYDGSDSTAKAPRQMARLNTWCEFHELNTAFVIQQYFMHRCPPSSAWPHIGAGPMTTGRQPRR
jgi:hypothetical protein